MQFPLLIPDADERSRTVNVESNVLRSFSMAQ